MGCDPDGTGPRVPCVVVPHTTHQRHGRGDLPLVPRGNMVSTPGREGRRAVRVPVYQGREPGVPRPVYGQVDPILVGRGGSYPWLRPGARGDSGDVPSLPGG